jgi:hypothetical protein
MIAAKKTGGALNRRPLAEFPLPRRTRGGEKDTAYSRIAVGYLVAIGLLLAGVAPALGGPDDATGLSADVAVARGLDYLSQQQQPDGSFDSPDGGGPKPAVTAAALLAFLASGNAPDVGRYGLVVHQAVGYLIDSAPGDALTPKPEPGGTIGRAMVVLALSQAYGAEIDAPLRSRLRPALERSAVALLKQQQPHKAGAWRADETATDADLVATAWAILALRCAQGADVHVAHEALEHAAEYVLKCRRGPATQEGFAIGNDAPSALVTAAGVWALELQYGPDRAEVKDSIKTLTDGTAADAARLPPAALLMVSLGAFRAGNAAWPAVWKESHDLLVTRQNPDGGWPATHAPSGTNAPGQTYDPPGRVWPTAMAMLNLSLPYRLMPLEER